MAERESGPITQATSGVVGVLPLTPAERSSTRVGARVGLSWPLRTAQDWFTARGVVTQAAILWALSRLLLALVTAASLLQRHQPLSHLLSAWAQWDAGWYLNIAQRGYWSTISAAFFPLYPLAIHGLALVLPFLPLVAVAMLVSTAGSLIAAIGIGQLARFEAGGPRAVPVAVAVTLAYPLAFFLAAPYTEGLFLACAVYALYAARRGYWGRAALCAFLAGLTRSTGLILVLPLLWEYGAQHKWWQRSAWPNGAWRARLHPRVLAWGALVAGAVPAAVAIVMAVDWRRFGDPLTFLHAEALYWAHANWTLWQTAGAILTNVLHPPTSSYGLLVMAVNLVPFAAMLVLTVVMVRRQSPASTLYMLGLLYLTFSAPVEHQPEVLVSAGRYLVVAFPLFLEVARWGESHPRLLSLGICLGTLAQLGLVYMFLQGRWVE